MTQVFQDHRYPRLFSLDECGLQPGVRPSQALKSIRGGTLFALTSPMQVIGHPTIGLYVDGACRWNGRPSARGAFGVYFGPDSVYNQFGTVPLDQPQTSQRAELMAAITALEQIEAVNVEDPSLEVFIMVTDSAYLVNSITNYIEKWKRNGWKTSTGANVKSRELWECLDSKLIRMSNQQDIDVLFWHADRSETVEADRLANIALDQ